MSQSFPASESRNSLMWSVILALLIDAPFFSILLLSGINTLNMALLVSILPITISAFIIYSSYAAGKMEYVLKEDELKVNFPPSPIKISYKMIRGAAKVETTLRLRLFGGSLPGSHWGTFSTSNLGSIQVYSTRYNGEFVLLELSGGDRILISPREPDAFIEALQKMTQFTTPNLKEVSEPRLDHRLAAVQIAVVTLAWLALATYIAAIYPGLPEVIPVHFGLNGVPNRYGSKLEMIYLVAISTIFPAMNVVFAAKFGKYNKGLNIFLSAVFVLALGLFALVVNQILQAI